MDSAMPELPFLTARLRVSSGGLRRLRWVAIAWIVVFWRLGYSSLMDPDEAHYAELTREMLRSHSWLVPLLDGKPFIDKPILFHWLQGASVALLGESELAARLPSAIAALVLFGITRWAGVALLGVEAGEWGAIMFATIPATFALSNIGLFDMVYTAFLFGAVGCLLVAAKEQRPRIELAGYALLTLAVMTKGPVALLLVGLFCSAAWLAGGGMRASMRRLRWPGGLVMSAIAASPWFVWMDGRFGSDFVQGYILAGNLFYFTQPTVFSSRAVSHTYYVRAFVGAFFPWSSILVGRAIDLLRRVRAGAESCTTEEKLLWLWSAIIIGFFSLARFKLDHYIFPAAPACCLIAARAWCEAARDEGRQWLATRISVFVVAGILLVAGSFGSVYLFELDLDLPAAAILFPIVLAVGGIILMTAAARAGWGVPSTPIAPVITLLASYVLIATLGYPALEQTRPTALVARTLRQMTPADAQVGIYNLEQWRASLRYYSERPIQKLSSPEDVLAFTSPEHPVYIVMLRRDYQDLRRGGLELREVFKCRAVIGTVKTGTGLRRQQWGDMIIVTDAPSRHRPMHPGP
jgi:4-amino-4-deoxy-L-arabinose transferase-like glycosyltransferase